MVATDYKNIRQAYKKIQDSDDIFKERRYYTTIDSNDGSYKATSLLAGRVLNDLQYLDARGQLCGSFEVTLKHNRHDFGSYYSVEVYSVELEVDDDSELYRTVTDYQDAGYEQLENIIKKYQS
jgi:hypothetical protein